MKRAFAYFAAAVTLLVGCSKEKDAPVEVNTGKIYTVTAVVDGPETRTITTYDEGTGKFKFAWEEGETIAVVPDEHSIALSFSLVDADEGVFSYTDESGESDYQSFGLAVTPAEALGANPSVNQYSVNLSGRYPYGKSNAVMIAGTPTVTNGNHKFQFKHAAALVKVTYRNIPAGTAAMVLTSENNIIGSASFTASTGVSIASGSLSGATGKEARVEFESATTAFIETADFYVPIPTGSYKTFQIKLVDEFGDIVTGSDREVSVSTPITVKAADVLMLPVTTLPKYYVKVTNTADLVNGTYLIVYEGGKTTTGASVDPVALNGGLASLDAVNNGIAVTITDSKILSDATVDAAAFTIDVSAGTIMSSTGNYIYCDSYANKLSQSTSIPSSFVNLFSIDDNGNALVEIKQGASGSVFLKYNYASNQNRFRYYTSSNQQPIALYLLDGPASPQPVTVAAPSFSPNGGTFTSAQVVTITSATPGVTIYYTTDGTEPTTATTTTMENGETISISSTCTLKAVAVKDGVSSAVTSAEFTISGGGTVGKTATYIVESTSAVSSTGEVPEGSIAEYSSTYSTKCQLTKSNSMTLTLKGYAGHRITGLTLSMKSNSSSGAGYMYMATKSGSTLTNFALVGSSASPKKFNDSAWNGGWSTSYVDVDVPVTATTIGSDEDIVIFIAATENSLYCQSFTVTYDGTPSLIGQVVTGGCSGESTTGATLSADFSGINADVHPQEAGFYYGFDEDHLDFRAVSSYEITGVSGTYTAVANQCAPVTTYYYKAYMVVWDPDSGDNGAYVDIVSTKVNSFTTTASTALPTGLLELPAYGSSDLVVTMYNTGGTSGTAENRNYTFHYSTSYYASMWVAYPLTYADTQGSASHSGSNWAFNTASGIAQTNQIDVCSNSYGKNYGNDLYSRGHQIPAADRKKNQTALDQTYLVTNQTPQIQNKFNGSIWQELEKAVRSQTSSADVIYVITGPTYRTVGGNESITWLNAQSSSIKPSAIPVPNYYWKVLLKVKTDASGKVVGASTIGFWFAHREYESSEEYTSFVTSVNDIESKTGFNLFANLPDDYEDAAEANASWPAFQSF